MRIIAHDQKRLIQHCIFPYRPQLLIAGIKVLGQFDLLKTAKLKKSLLRDDLLEGSFGLFSWGMKILNFEQAGTIEIINIIGNIYCDLIV